MVDLSLDTGLMDRFVGGIYCMEDLALIRKQEGFISGGIMTLLVGGLALGGLLLYGSKSGQELPLWPAIAVCLVNLVAAIKIILDVKKARKLRQEAASNNAKAIRPPR